ncbi:MAG: class I SAM-dependent methyltransferase [Bdellovibrionales bacterium]|nr:class I SAM-dependent methyltransferase [Bdellovibrionales bacterium]
MRPLRTANPQEIVKELARSILAPGEGLSPWKRLLGKRSSTQRTLLFSLEQPTSGTVVNDLIEFSGWGTSFSSEDIQAQIYIGATQIHEIDFTPEGEDESVVSFSFGIPWEQAVGENTTDAEIVVRVQHGSEELVIGPLLILRTESPLMRHLRGSSVQTWGETLEDVCSAELGERTATEIASAIAKLLEISKNDRILEIGCGRGEVGAKIAPLCDQWVGCDFSGSTLSIAIQNLKHLPNLQLEQLSQPSLTEWGNSSFEKVYCTSLLMYLDEWERYRIIQEAFRVLRPGGSCYFDAVNLCGDLGWQQFEEEASRDAAGRPANIIKTCTPQELETYFQRAGFEKVRLFPGERMVAATAAKPRS